jgi:hypothetical protein
MKYKPCSGPSGYINTAALWRINAVIFIYFRKTNESLNVLILTILNLGNSPLIYDISHYSPHNPLCYISLGYHPNPHFPRHMNDLVDHTAHNELFHRGNTSSPCNNSPISPVQSFTIIAMARRDTPITILVVIRLRLKSAFCR